jgi:molybdate transport system substrate-binding protein
LLLVSIAAVACGGSSGDETTLTVFAAASLTASFEELGEAFEEEQSNVTVEFNFAGSQALATQLIEGAEADAFASANPEQMARVTEAELIEGEPLDFVNNSLIIITPTDNPAGVEDIYDLADPDLKLVLAAEDVPVGNYARQTLAALEASPELAERYPDFTGWNIVSNETNVLQVVTRVRLGEADAGIVYRTDVTPDIADQVLIVPIDEAFNVIATYPIAALSGGDTDLAGEFIDFVLSDEGAAILAGWGFEPTGP